MYLHPMAPGGVGGAWLVMGMGMAGVYRFAEDAKSKHRIRQEGIRLNMFAFTLCIERFCLDTLAQVQVCVYESVRPSLIFIQGED